MSRIGGAKISSGEKTSSRGEKTSRIVAATSKPVVDDLSLMVKNIVGGSRVAPSKISASSRKEDNDETLLVIQEQDSVADSGEKKKNNGFMERLGEIMSDESVRAFFADYFQTWSDGQASLMIILAYNAIDQAYAQQNDGARLSSDEIVPLVRRAVCDFECRKVLCSAMQRYIADDMSAFTSLLLHDSTLRIKR